MAPEEVPLLQRLVGRLRRHRRDAGRLRRRRRDADMIRSSISAAICIIVLASTAAPQSQRPDFSGVWGPYRAARGADSRLAAVPAGTPVLKAPYAKPYEERRAAEAAATQRG